MQRRAHAFDLVGAERPEPSKITLGALGQGRHFRLQFVFTPMEAEVFVVRALEARQSVCPVGAARQRPPSLPGGAASSTTLGVQRDDSCSPHALVEPVGEVQSSRAQRLMSPDPETFTTTPGQLEGMDVEVSSIALVLHDWPEFTSSLNAIATADADTPPEGRSIPDIFKELHSLISTPQLKKKSTNTHPLQRVLSDFLYK